MPNPTEHWEWSQRARKWLSALEAAAKQFEGITSQLLRATPSISPSLLGAVRSAAHLKSVFLHSLEVPTQLWRMLADASRAWGEVLEALREFDRGSSLLVELGWPPHGSMPLLVLRTVTRVYDKEGAARARETLNAMMLNYYGTDQVRRILIGWKQRQWLSARIPALEQAVGAHLGGLYYTSIPVVLAQTEGMLADAFGHNTRLSGRDLKKYVGRLCRRPNGFDVAARRFALEVVLAAFEFGGPIPSSLSRHAIMHGADTEYGTQTNSLKAILLFDYLQSRIGVVSVGRGQAYHRLTCPLAKHRGKERMVYMTALEAEADGKRPCGRCRPTGEAVA